LIHHEPDNTHCPCGCALKRIGEDVSEKLDYTPGVFTVERHVRGKWVCDFRINGSWFNHARRAVRTHSAPVKAGGG
jgi:transposase